MENETKLPIDEIITLSGFMGSRNISFKISSKVMIHLAISAEKELDIDLVRRESVWAVLLKLITQSVAPHLLDSLKFRDDSFRCSAKMDSQVEGAQEKFDQFRSIIEKLFQSEDSFMDAVRVVKSEISTLFPPKEKRVEVYDTQVDLREVTDREELQKVLKESKKHPHTQYILPEDCSYLFYCSSCSSWYIDGVGANWDLSNVKNMSRMFYKLDIGMFLSCENWDTSSVVNMSGMFEDVNFRYSDYGFDIGNWDVSNVTDMSDMFRNSTVEADVTNWDVSSVKNMSRMFYRVDNDSVFNTKNWDTSSVTDMSGMFQKARCRVDISSWNSSSVTDISDLFNASFVDAEVTNWDLSNVTQIKGIFNGRNVKKPDIGKWNLGRVENHSYVQKLIREAITDKNRSHYFYKSSEEFSKIIEPIKVSFSKHKRDLGEDLAGGIESDSVNQVTPLLQLTNLRISTVFNYAVYCNASKVIAYLLENYPLKKLGVTEKTLGLICSQLEVEDILTTLKNIHKQDSRLLLKSNKKGCNLLWIVYVQRFHKLLTLQLNDDDSQKIFAALIEFGVDPTAKNCCGVSFNDLVRNNQIEDRYFRYETSDDLKCGIDYFMNLPVEDSVAILSERRAGFVLTSRFWGYILENNYGDDTLQFFFKTAYIESLSAIGLGAETILVSDRISKEFKLKFILKLGSSIGYFHRARV